MNEGLESRLGTQDPSFKEQTAEFRATLSTYERRRGGVRTASLARSALDPENTA